MDLFGPVGACHIDGTFQQRPPHPLAAQAGPDEEAHHRPGVLIPIDLQCFGALEAGKGRSWAYAAPPHPPPRKPVGLGQIGRTAGWGRGGVPGAADSVKK